MEMILARIEYLASMAAISGFAGAWRNRRGKGDGRPSESPSGIKTRCAPSKSAERPVELRKRRKIDKK